MATTDTVITSRPASHFIRRWRHIRESATAYLFMLPAFLIIATFGLFPMVFSIYVSLHRWRIVPGGYLALQNYVNAIENLAYVAGIWLAILLIATAVRSVIKAARQAREHGDKPWLWFIPALVTAGGIFQFIRFAVLFLPAVLDIAEQVKGQKRTQELFTRLLGEAWRLPEVASSRLTTILILVAGVLLAYAFARWVRPGARSMGYYTRFIGFFVMLGVAAAVGWLTLTEIQKAYATAAAEGTEINIWPSVLIMSVAIVALIALTRIAAGVKLKGRAYTFVIMGGLLVAGALKLMVDSGKASTIEIVSIVAGLILLFFSWKMWKEATKSSSTLGLIGWILAAILMMVAAWALVAELPRAIQAGYKDWWQGLQVTFYYSLTTVPVELALGLFLAVLLFQKIKGKGLFRLIYFLPYITSPVAAAAVFRIIFSSRVTAPLNSLMNIFGMKPLLWLDEPKGIFQLLMPALEIPTWLAGPSLAMIAIAIYGIWSFTGYNAVVFLAGLGSIPPELYEAASIDGAGRWQQFRHITLPLLSPTTYFLTLVAVIGTFKAFTHLWVLRSGAALGTTDTASIVIFNEFNRNTRYGYASALALILLAFVLVLTLINNRIAEEKVFYG